MSGTGNDFIVIDNRSLILTGNEEALIHRMCRRRVSIGADGLILVEEGEHAPVRMRYFNADGKESTMCGNGARCTAFFAYQKGIVKRNDFILEAPDGLHPVKVSQDRVFLQMTPPRNYQTNLAILREDNLREGGFIDTGVPHYVIFADDLDAIDVEILGDYYRRHPTFPEGTNVNFVQLESDYIKVRTYERGVERETLSCGTGCVASALITGKKFGQLPPITVQTRGGVLKVTFDEPWERIRLEANVEIVYEGKYEIKTKQD